MDFSQKQMEFKHFGAKYHPKNILLGIYYVFDKPFYRYRGKVFYPHLMKIKQLFYSHFCPKIKVLRHFLSKKRPQRKTPSRSDLIIQFCLLWLMGYAQKHSIKPCVCIISYFCKNCNHRTRI